MIGKTLAHYQITSEIGKGGMGEVYQAKDQKLGRDVAIKVLPEEFAKDTDRIARFQREAKLLASLNHPNIAAIHGLEEADGIHFLVMELIEGDTLADRIKSGSIPLEESLKLALQITEALEAAHEKGVIHRDLKPANIKVTPDGKVKVLDFGLAKAYAGDPENINMSNSPTLSDAATQHGVILGTVAYMSPEQARGKPVDRRADIWAFGAVLYEMLTGRQAFQGEDVSETLASVIKGDTNLDLLPINIHPKVRETLERCLEKDIKNRYHDIADARVDIQKVLADPSGVSVQPSVITKPKKKLRVGIPWVAAIAILCLIVAGVAVWYFKPSEPRQVIRFDYELPEGLEFSVGDPLVVSPDGKQIVYGTPDGLYLRPVDELTARLITGTEGEARWPFFSPDGNWIGYFSPEDQRLKKIPVNGGTSITLCGIERFAGGSWGADGTILYSELSDIMRIPDSGGTPESLVSVEQQVIVSPQILPDGKSLLYTLRNRSGTLPRIMVKPLKSGEPKELLAGYFCQYLPTGHIVFWPPDSEEYDLFAVPFDLDRLEIAAEQQIMVVEDFGQGFISETGTLAYVPITDLSLTDPILVWIYLDGKEEPLNIEPDNYTEPSVSPDGTKVAVHTNIGENDDIRIYDLVRENWTRLTRDEAIDTTPLWFHDSQKVIFGSNREGEYLRIYWKSASGTGEVEEIHSMEDAHIWPMSLSKDGSTLFFQITYLSGGLDIGMVSMDGDRTETILLQEEYNEAYPMISPDDQWLAYHSNESDQYEVYIRPFPDLDSGERRTVSTNGGYCPLWSPNGETLYYRSPDGIMAVSVETDPTLTLGKPESLFPDIYRLSTSGSFMHNIHPDGERFLMIKWPETTEEESAEEESAEEPQRIIVVTNWFEELKDRVPVK